MDGIDFKKIVFGDDINLKIQARFPNIPDLPVIHFISPKYESPRFNNMEISNFDFTHFHLSSSHVFTLLATLINNNVSLQQLKKIDEQIDKQSYKYNQLHLFMNSPGFRKIFTDPVKARKILMDSLTKYVCEQIGLDKIGYTNRVLHKSRK